MIYFKDVRIVSLKMLELYLEVRIVSLNLVTLGIMKLIVDIYGFEQEKNGIK